MSGEKAPLSVYEGADTPLYLLELPNEIIPEYQG
jgi:hypothetical protein